MDQKKRTKIFVVAAALSAITIGGLWWAHDPLRGIRRYEVSDQTIFYRQTEPLFYGVRRERTIFAKGISMDQVLSQAKSNYAESDGWQYDTKSMPVEFRAERTVPGDRIPESIRASQDLDGKLEIQEMRAVPPVEAQLVKHLEGSDAFLIYPGQQMYKPMAKGNLDGTRFLLAN